MADESQHDAEPMQKTQPRGIDPETGKPYEPVEIPVPTRGDFARTLQKVARRIVQKTPQSGEK